MKIMSSFTHPHVIPKKKKKMQPKPISFFCVNYCLNFHFWVHLREHDMIYNHFVVYQKFLEVRVRVILLFFRFQ